MAKAAVTATSRSIIEGWRFTRTGGVGGEDALKEGEWLNVKQFPTTVHVELLKYGKIPDPVRLHLLCHVSSNEMTQYNCNSICVCSSLSV